MPEVRIRISATVTLIAHPAHPAATPAMTEARALAALSPARTNTTLMARLRHLLPTQVRTNHMTDDQVLKAIAVDVARHTILLQVRTTTQSTPKVKFADMVKNYPTNQAYATSPTVNPNIWTYIGGKIQYNGTTPDPKSTTTPKAMIFSNSCATRMSRALNYSGAPVAHHATGTVSGADGKWYLFRVADLDPEMTTLFGSGKTLSLATWRADIAGKTGVVKFTARWANATGHFTLWDGSKMINGAADEQDARDPAVNGVKFWEVK
jgi:hypothetical protein